MKHLNTLLLLALLCTAGALAQNSQYPYDKLTCPYYDPDDRLGDFYVIRQQIGNNTCTYYDEAIDANYTYELVQDGSTINRFYYARTDRTEPNQVLYVPGWVKYVQQTPWGEPDGYDTDVEVFDIQVSNVHKSSSNFYKIILPKSLSMLECNLWGECTFLKEMIINCQNIYAASSFLNDDVLESYFTQIEMITITPNVRHIEARLLYDSEKLKTLVFNAETTEMEDDKMFEYCDVLEKVFIGPQVLEMPYALFKDLEGIKTVQWDAENFHGWSEPGAKLFGTRFDLIMGSKIESIGPNTFNGCNIKSVCAQDLNSWMQIRFANAQSNPLSVCGTFKLRKVGGDMWNTEDYYDEFTNGIDLTGYSGPIGDYQFYGCQNMEKITIPATVTSYGTSFLGNCSNLKEIYLHGTPRTDNMNAFNGLTRKNITLILDNEEIYNEYHNIALLQGFRITYPGMPVADQGHRVEFPYNGVAFAQFDENVSIPEGVNAYYTQGNITTKTFQFQEYYELVKYVIHDVIPANTIVLLTGAEGDHYFPAAEQGASPISNNALHNGGTGASNVYKMDITSALPRFIPTVVGETIPTGNYTFTISNSGGHPDAIYIEFVNHEHSFDTNGFCTYENPTTHIHCQAVVEPMLNSDGYYEIDKPAQMMWLANYCLLGDSRNAKLTADLDFSSLTQQVSVGTSEHPYTGTFDGNGHTITLNLTGATNNYAGVFGVVGQNGYIHHLNVSGLINRPQSHAAGSVAGVLIDATVKYCSSDAELRGLGFAGGLVGAASGSTIENCAFTGRFTLGQLPYGIVEMAPNSTVRSCMVASTGIADINGLNVDFQNCYALNDETASAFASGEICWKLNGNSATGVWKQSLSKHFDPNAAAEPDALPTLDATHATVYTCADCLGHTTYANTDNLGTIEHSFEGAAVNGAIPCDNGCGALLIATWPGKLQPLCLEHNGQLSLVEEGEVMQLYVFTGFGDETVYAVTSGLAMGSTENFMVAGVPFILTTTASSVLFEPAERDYDYKNNYDAYYQYDDTYEAIHNRRGMQGVLKEGGVTVDGPDYLVFTENGLKFSPENVHVEKGQGFLYANSPISSSVLDVSEVIASYINAYEIGTADKLYAFAAMVNGGRYSLNAVLTADIVVNENVLNADGSLSSQAAGFREWTPIGVEDFEVGGKSYTGTFDGKGHTIGGLYISDPSRERVGLFGSIGEGGVVRRLGLIDSYFDIHYKAGGICTYNHGLVEHCYNAARCKVYYSGVGGIAVTNTGTITHCYNVGEMVGASYSGAICGDNTTDGISDCYYLKNSYCRGIGIESPMAFHGGTTEMTATQFANGEVAWQLNGAEAGQSPVWRQTIGEDTYPVLDAAKGIVLKAISTGLNTIARPTAGEIKGAEKVYNFAGILGTDVYGLEYTDSLIAGRHPYVFTTDQSYVSFVPSNETVTDDTYTYGLTGVLTPEGQTVYGNDNTAGRPVSLVFTTSALKYAHPNGNLVKYGKAYVNAADAFLFGFPIVSSQLPIRFEDKATGLDDPDAAETEGRAYNLMGQEVGKDYHGIILLNGKKTLRH